MKTMFKGAAFAAAMLTAMPALAQAGGVVTIDLNRIFTESAAGKSGSSQIQTKYQATASSQQAAFNTAAAAYNTQVEAARKAVKPDGSLPDANRTALQAAETKLRQANDAAEKTQNEANQVGAYVRDQIVRAVAPLAEQVRAERKASAVIPRNEVLAADPAADVTTTVMQRLDAQLKTVSIVLPQAPAQNQARPAAAQQQPPQGR